MHSECAAYVDVSKTFVQKSAEALVKRVPFYYSIKERFYIEGFCMKRVNVYFRVIVCVNMQTDPYIYIMGVLKRGSKVKLKQCEVYSI